MFTVYYFDRFADQWQEAKRDLSTYAAACRWAAQFETRSLRTCVRRQAA